MLPINLVPFYNVTAYRPSDGTSLEFDIRGLGGELMGNADEFAKAIQDLIGERFGDDVVSTLSYYNAVQTTIRQIDNTPPPPETPEEPPAGGDTSTEEPPPVETPPETPPEEEHPVDGETPPNNDPTPAPEPGTDTTTESAPDTTTDTTTQ